MVLLLSLIIEVVHVDMHFLIDPQSGLKESKVVVFAMKICLGKSVCVSYKWLCIIWCVYDNVCVCMSVCVCVLLGFSI